MCPTAPAGVTARPGFAARRRLAGPARRDVDHLPPAREQRGAGLQAQAGHRRASVDRSRRPVRSPTSPVLKNAAYLISWARPVDVVDRNRAAARRLLLRRHLQPGRRRRSSRSCPALPGNYHGEGAHVITLPGRARRPRRQQRALHAADADPSAAAASTSTTSATRRNPQTLVAGARATTAPVDTLVCCDRGRRRRGSATIANDYHSVFMWRDGGKVYLIGVDNNEQAHRRRHLRHHQPGGAGGRRRVRPRSRSSPDDRRRRRRPRYGELDLPARHGRQGDQRRPDAARVLLGRRLRAAQRRRPGRRRSTSATRRSATSTRSTGKAVRPRATATRPSSRHDNKYVLAADEDFDQYRLRRSIDPGADERLPTFVVAGAADRGPASSRPTRRSSGDTRFVGKACTPERSRRPTDGVNDRRRRARHVQLPGQDRERRGPRLRRR